MRGTEPWNRARGIASGPDGRGGGATPDPAFGRPVFIYGTLLSPRVMRRQAGSLRPLRLSRPASLPGHRKVALPGTPYPSLRPEARAVTSGRLLRLTASQLARLQAYEGAPYRLRPVRVLTRRGPRQAWAWITPSWLLRDCAPRPAP